MKTKIVFIFLLGFYSVMPVFSQQQTEIKGTVFDSEGALPGASVTIKGKTVGTITNIDGNYSLQAEANDTLIFSFVGMQSQEIAVGGRQTVNIVLSEESTLIDEVVIAGYAPQKRSDLTGAVAPVNQEDLDKRRVAEVSQALQGQVAGVQITQSTGSPGDEIHINIRGVGTVGNNTPLFIIDGVPVQELGFLNPSDIKSMTVLKDASAAAIYGSRAAAGVIVITTKQGEKGKSSLEVNVFKGFQQVTNLPTMLNTEQYLNIMEEAWNNGNPSNAANNPYTVEKQRTDLADTDWLGELFELGKTQNYQLTASGGNDKTQYLISGGYYGQDGIVVYDNDQYQRYNFRANVNADVTDRMKLGTNLQLSYTIQDALSSSGDAPGIIRHALLRPPTIPVYKDPSDPTYSERDPFTDLPFYKHNDFSTGGFQTDLYEWTSNPVALAYFTNDVRKHYKTFGNVYGEYSFLEDKELTFRTNLGIDLNYYNNKEFKENYGDDDGGGNRELDAGLGRKNRPSELTEDRSEALTTTWNNTLNYVKTFHKHSINALAGTEFITNSTSNIGGSRQRYEYYDENFQYLDFGSTEQDLGNGGSGSEWALFSLFGTATYVYDHKYMLTTTMRADASSRFAENNRWGYFPSVSAGWKISEEYFMDSYNWLSDLKLRASWGQLGNQEIDNYAYLTLLKKQGENFVVDRYGNPDLKWETATQTNFGVDFAILKNKLSLIADYFIKNTTDMLLPVSLPSIVGDVQATLVNAGAVRNSGFELGVNWRENKGKFKYSINANIATLKNEVVELHPNLPVIEGDVTRTVVGQPINSYFGYVMEGIYQNEEEIQNHQHNTTNILSQPGDIRFADLNGDGVIDDKDRTFIGSPIPDFTYGLTFNAEYKGFDFSIFFQGVQGVDRYNDGKQILNYDSRPFNYTDEVLDRWTGEGTSNTTPRVTDDGDNGGNRVSTVFVEDASYLRLKNLEVGYSFRNLFNKVGVGEAIKNLRVYFSAQNVFTITGYTGLDPESTNLVDKGTYPQSRVFLFGADFKF